jgi:hypothetical protein
MKVKEKITYFRSASGIVNGAGDEDSPLAIDDDSLLIVGDTTLDQLRTKKQGREEQD